MIKVLDVSASQVIHGEGVQSFKQEINQLYRPCGLNQCDPDSFDFVYSHDDISKSKFFQILIKEWFYLPKAGGYLVIDYAPNKNLSPLDIEDELWLQWKGRFDILEHRCISADDSFTDVEGLSDYVAKVLNAYNLPEDKSFDDVWNVSLRNKKWRLVIRKNINCMGRGDSIDKWTFGIITNGERDEWMRTLVESIRALSIPEYEIIVCGRYNVPDESTDIAYLPFNKRSKQGWITKKKNLILNSAKYENVIIVHDRYCFDSEWHNGMRLWGNNFELLTCRQYFKDTGIRFLDRAEILNSRIPLDWKTLRSPNTVYFTGEMDDRDFYHSTCLGGGVLILKKSVGIHLCETLFWNNYEDNEYSINSAYHNGIYPRISPYSKLYTHVYQKISTINELQADYRLKYNPKSFEYIYDRRSPRLLRKKIFVWFLGLGESQLGAGILSLLRSFYHKSNLIRIFRV